MYWEMWQIKGLPTKNWQRRERLRRNRFCLRRGRRRWRGNIIVFGCWRIFPGTDCRWSSITGYLVNVRKMEGVCLFLCMEGGMHRKRWTRSNGRIRFVCMNPGRVFTWPQGLPGMIGICGLNQDWTSFLKPWFRRQSWRWRLIPIRYICWGIQPVVMGYGGWLPVWPIVGRRLPWWPGIREKCRKWICVTCLSWSGWGSMMELTIGISWL